MMAELCRLIAVEGLYQYMAGHSIRNRVMLSRRDFCCTAHTVVMGVDQLLDCMKLGIVPIPDTKKRVQNSGLVDRDGRAITGQG